MTEIQKFPDQEKLSNVLPSDFLLPGLHPQIVKDYNYNYNFRKKEITEYAAIETTGRYPDGSLFGKNGKVDEKSDLWQKRIDNLLHYIPEPEFTKMLPAINHVRDNQQFITPFEKYLRIEAIVLAFDKKARLDKKIQESK